MKIIETKSYLKIKEAIGTDFGRGKRNDFHPGKDSYGKYYQLYEQKTRRLMSLSDEVLQERIDNLTKSIRKIHDDVMTGKISPTDGAILGETPEDDLYRLISERGIRKDKAKRDGMRQNNPNENI